MTAGQEGGRVTVEEQIEWMAELIELRKGSYAFDPSGETEATERGILSSLRRLAALDAVYRAASAVVANARLGADGGAAIEELAAALSAVERDHE